MPNPLLSNRVAELNLVVCRGETFVRPLIFRAPPAEGETEGPPIDLTGFVFEATIWRHFVTQRAIFEIQIPDPPTGTIILILSQETIATLEPATYSWRLFQSDPLGNRELRIQGSFVVVN